MTNGRSPGGRRAPSSGAERFAEEKRLAEDARRRKNWKRWGPYLAERQWGTVREDYSADGDAWRYFPHAHARSRAYRWGEDGLLGFSDRECRLCFAPALWNGRDPILKERLFGLGNEEGNHGEDVKECYFYLDATPTHSYMKGLYRYPQGEFPYERLAEESRRRGRSDPEFELADTGVFDSGRYFDVLVEYAKASPDDILIRITASNRGPEPAKLSLLPTLWYRNTWSWGRSGDGFGPKPSLAMAPRSGSSGVPVVAAEHATLGRFLLAFDTASSGAPPTILFTENETNAKRLFGAPNRSPFVKDAFHDRIVLDRSDAVNSDPRGTKAAFHTVLDLAPGASAAVRLRLFREEKGGPRPRTRAGLFGPAFDETVQKRIREADEFYAARIPAAAPEEDQRIARQAYAGLLWTKQFYHYAVSQWQEGDPQEPPPPEERRLGRNHDWIHLYNRDVISMPDKWEYPWYAAWDLAFQMIPFTRCDPAFAKEQLILLLREWYMHPNGQIPAYEYDFADANPPVHAWACWRVYKMTGVRRKRDRLFLARAFQKLLLNFTWWVNRKDVMGNHIFSGGFLGLDNIGIFDRSRPLPSGGVINQADGTAWMAFYCATMLSIALELARFDPAYEDVASKFFEHFIAIADAMNTIGGTGLWDEEDGFYYDQIRTTERTIPLKIRSMVGLIPLFAVEVLEDGAIRRLPGFTKRMRWFLENRPELAAQIACMETGVGPRRTRRILAIPARERLVRVLRYLFDEEEFLAPYGVRSLSRAYKDRPYAVTIDGREHRVAYVPGEADSGLFGGNSNWRGPVWIPLNYLLVEALERYHHAYGDSIRIECPTGSGRVVNLREAALEISGRVARIFRADRSGRRACHGDDERFASDPRWRDLLLFHEYFDGDTGRGLGAGHQTGWTALIARLLEDLARESDDSHPGGRPRR